MWCAPERIQMNTQILAPKPVALRAPDGREIVVIPEGSALADPGWGRRPGKIYEIGTIDGEGIYRCTVKWYVTPQLDFVVLQAPE